MVDTKVIGLRPEDSANLKIIGKVPNQDVISSLENLLRLAKEGDLQAIAYVGAVSGDRFIRNSMGICKSYTFIGALETLKQEFVERSFEDDYEVEPGEG